MSGHSIGGTTIALAIVAILIGGALGVFYLGNGSLASSTDSSPVSTFAHNPQDNWNEMATDGSYVYATTQAGQVQKIDRGTGEVVNSTQLIDGPGIDGIYSDGEYLYVGTSIGAANYTLYKLDLNLRLLYRLVDPTIIHGIASVVVPDPGGNVYFGDGEGAVYEYGPNLSVMLASNRVFPHTGFAYSISDALYDGTSLWWMNRLGDILVTDLNLRTLAAGSLPVNTLGAGGFAITQGEIFVGDAQGGFWRVSLPANGNLTFSEEMVLQGNATDIGKHPTFSNGSLFVPLRSKPGVVLVYAYPSLNLTREFVVPDGERLGMGFGSEMITFGSQILLLTNSTIYSL